MLIEQRYHLTDRIISGICLIFIDGTEYEIRKPSRIDRYRANLAYEQAKEEVLYEGFLTKGGALNYLKYVKLWSDNEEQQLKDLDKKIDDLKVALYKNFVKAAEVKRIRNELKNARNLSNQLDLAKRALDYITVEGYASVVKLQYLIASSLYKDGGKVWPNNEFLSEDYSFLERVLKEYNSQSINIEQFRELARTEPWRSYWQAGKNNIFGFPSVDFTEEQKNLVLFSLMYDNVFQNPEAPSDDIIEDADALDGWFIEQRRELEKGKKTKQADKLIPQKGDEIYLPVKDKNYKENRYQAGPKWDIKEVDKLNSVEAQITKKERFAIIKEKGKVKEQHLPDVKRKIQTLATEKFRQTVKGA